ncbi:MAG: tetratricopeptide repeat protein [Opitutaceae bacterium]|nr:tetratricopeptide repeat protein [Opitutaceae bacterium]
MSTPEPTPAPVTAADKYAFDETTLHRLWRQYGQLLMLVCAAVLLAILAKGGWDFFAAQKEDSVREAYAAATTSEKLKTFAEAHSSHVLAGIARLRLADEAYAAGRGAEAVAAYEAAVPALQDSVLTARARLGVAMARIQAGRTADGEAALRELVGQADLAKATRAEAGYHLATLAHAAGRTDDVLKYCDQVMEIDAGSAWAQRAQMLRLQATVASTQGQALPAPASLPAAPASEEPTIKLNLPTGK